MSSASTFILLPFIVAFLIFVLRFYSRERLGSLVSPSFLLAIMTSVIAGAYLVLRIMDDLPPYSTIGFLTVGLVLLATSVLRMFRI